MVQRPGSAQEVHHNTLMVQVWLGQRLLFADCPEQLLQFRVILQGVWLANGNVCQVDDCQIVVNCHVASLQMFV